MRINGKVLKAEDKSKLVTYYNRLHYVWQINIFFIECLDKSKEHI